MKLKGCLRFCYARLYFAVRHFVSIGQNSCDINDNTFPHERFWTMAQQYIMTIEHMTRLYDEKEVLSDIWLAFYPGAKIGVLGGNGSGKSTLMRIMAGEDTDYMGTVRPAKGIRIGYFSQEPRLDPEKTVGECIEDAVAEIGRAHV